MSSSPTHVFSRSVATAAATTALNMAAVTTTAVDAIPFPTRAPDWLDNTSILYQIVPKQFTKGPVPRTTSSSTGDRDVVISDGSTADDEAMSVGYGNFNTMKAKLPYLKELGVHFVWVSGQTLAGERFYGIWSPYGNIDPSKVEPTLGTEAELKSFIDAAHAHGIKVILDWQTVGVMNGTELARSRPELFFDWDETDVAKTDAYEMQSYRWDGAAWREWYVSTAVDMITKFGFDGFRVDSGFDYIANMFAYDRNFSRAETDAVLNGSASAWLEIAVKVPHALVMPENNYYCPAGQACSGHMTEHDHLAGNYEKSNPRPFPVRSPSLPRCHETIALSYHDSRPGMYSQRSLIGYYIWSQLIPVVLNGDEFDTPFGPAVPWAKAGAYGGDKPMDCPPDHAGCWPYAVPVQWEYQEREGSVGRAFSQDIQSMIAVQQANTDLLHKNICRSNVMAAPNATALPHMSDPKRALPPYIRYNGAGEGVLIVANPQQEDPVNSAANSSQVASYVFNLAELLQPGSNFTTPPRRGDGSGAATEEAEEETGKVVTSSCMNVTTLWGVPPPKETHQTDAAETVGGSVVVCGAAAERFAVSVSADRRRGGGIAAYRLLAVVKKQS